MNATPPLDTRTDLATSRTGFAVFRTSLALDRTTLAWIRTALTFATFGFGMIGFFRAMEQSTGTPEAARLHQAAIHVGAALVLLGVIATLLSAASHWTALRKLRRGEILSVAQWPLTISVAVLLAVLGLYGLWSLLFGK
jgi:putative membrane protein